MAGHHLCSHGALGGKGGSEPCLLFHHYLPMCSTTTFITGANFVYIAKCVPAGFSGGIKVLSIQESNSQNTAQVPANQTVKRREYLSTGKEKGGGKKEEEERA